jgi:hypothetical protein
MMVSVWQSPPAGDIQNSSTSLPWRRGDTANIEIKFLEWVVPDKVEITGGSLPPGLFYNTATKIIQGTITALDKDILAYPVIFRATLGNGRVYDRSFNFVVNPVDEEQYWRDQPVDPNPSDGIPPLPEFLGSYSRGSSITLPLNLVNPDQDKIEYTVVGFKHPSFPGSYEGIPNGLKVDSFGRIVGAPTITLNHPGEYLFKVYARDPDDLVRAPRGEGSPRTSEKSYRININVDVVLDARLSDVVRWDTLPGSLGSIYETYPSHFAVHASPQYDIDPSNSSESQMVRYSLTGTSSPLPNGLILDPLTGLIIGRAPYVIATKTFNFTVEARIVFQNNSSGAIRLSDIASQRSFSLTVRSLFSSDSLTTFYMPVSSNVREKIAQWIWGNRAELREEHQPIDDNEIPASRTSDTLTILGRNQIYRTPDDNFGRVKQYKILLATGIRSVNGDLTQYLKDYHHPFDLKISGISSAKARTLEGEHIYDVVYLIIGDNQQGAGGFSQQGNEVAQVRSLKKPTAIPQWNIPENDPKYYPNSIRNLRLDLIKTSNRLTGHPGLGSGTVEGLPSWMISEQEAGKPETIPGYQCVIEVAHVKANSGPGVVKSLIQGGILKDLAGMRIPVDRYLVLSDGSDATWFDLTDTDPDYRTLFDGPQVTVISPLPSGWNANAAMPTAEYTTFDTTLQSDSKYYKFPSGLI